MKKRFLGLFLVFAMLFACVPGMAARAAGTDLSANVKVTDFRFLVDGTETTVLTPGKTVTAECKLERTAVGTGAQNYCFILQVIDNGKLIDLKKLTGSISAADGKKTISVASAALGQDTAKYEVVALLVSDMTTMAPLAMPANFKNSTCDIASITVAGNKVPLEAGKTDYSMDLNIMESEMPPAIEVIPYDLSTDITVNNISGDSGTATVTAVSHDGKSTVQYNIALNITTLKPASLKSVTVDGTPLAGFAPNILEYRINPSSEAVPVIAFEKALASTETTVIAATELPGTTVVKTKAADGSELTYKFQFTKTVEVTPFKAGETYAGKMGISSSATMNDFKFNNGVYWNLNGEILAVKGGSESKPYIAFQPNLPAGSIVNRAEIDLTLKGLDGKNANQGKLHFDLYENTDTAWTANTDGQYTLAEPAYGSSTVNDELIIPVGDTFNTYTYNIDPSTVQGKDIVSFTGTIREGSAWDTLFLLRTRTADMPKLRITYYKDYVEPEKLASVTFDGKNYSAFDSNKLEYKIPSTDGQTTCPVIAATAGASSTKITIKQASGFPGKATVTTEAADGKSLTYTFIFLKTVEVTPAAAAVSLETGGKALLRVASDNIGNYMFSSGRINRSGRIFVGNTYFKDKAHIAFQPNLPADAVVDSAELDLAVSAVGSIKHINIYENTDTAWMNTAGESEAAAPAFGSAVLNNETTFDANYTKQTYQIEPIFQGRDLVSLTVFAKEATDSWSDYAVVELRDVVPTLRINYYREDSTAAEGQVTAVSVGGKRLEEFDPAKYDYIIKTDAGTTEVPEITYTLADNTTATYTPAAELPGTAKIVTSGGLTYQFKLAKTEKIAASAVGNKRYGQNDPFMTPAAADWSKTTFYNYGTQGRMLMVNWNGSYTDATSYAYFYFDTAVPADCKVMDAAVSLTAGGFIKSGTGAESVHLDLFENTDTAWVTDNTPYGTANVVPAISENKINTDSPDIPGTDPETFNRYTYQITPESISGKTGYGICALGRELHDGFKIYSEISVRTGEEPVLTITYYKD